MKSHTPNGDDGTTGLIGDQRVRKCDPRIDCLGALDELNACIGLAGVQAEGELAGPLRRVQEELFVIGAHLAGTGEGSAEAHLPPLDESMVRRLEMEIDGAERQLPALRQFILPGGTEVASGLHLARTVCRRAERVVVGFAMQRPAPPIILPYLNRLSDWLFVMARLANHRAGVEDAVWGKPKGQGGRQG
jgi:cob(I)alamin adenosyltransferase